MENIYKVLNLDESNHYKINKTLSTIKHLSRNNYNTWLSNKTSVLKQYVEVFNLSDIKVYETARLGLVLGAKSKFGNVVIKVIPDYLNIYDIECNAYKRLSTDYMCDLIYCNDNNKILMLKELDNSKTLIFKKDKQDLELFFDKVYKDIVPSIEGEINYIDILKKYISILDKNNRLKLYKDYEKDIFDIYDNYYKDTNKYLMHLDLHRDNILKNGNSYYAIDPLGYSAPLDFMFVRYIVLELFYENEINRYVYELIDFISKYFEKESVIRALYIDSYFVFTTLLTQFTNTTEGEKKCNDILKLTKKLYKGEL